MQAWTKEEWKELENEIKAFLAEKEAARNAAADDKARESARSFFATILSIGMGE
jgi:hypothetical protein